MKTPCEGEVKENDQSLNRVSSKFGTKKQDIGIPTELRLEIPTFRAIANADKCTCRKIEILLDIVFDSRRKEERRISDIGKKLPTQRDQRREFDGWCRARSSGCP